MTSASNCRSGARWRGRAQAAEHKRIQSAKAEAAKRGIKEETTVIALFHEAVGAEGTVVDFMGSEPHTHPIFVNFPERQRGWRVQPDQIQTLPEKVSK